MYSSALPSIYLCDEWGGAESRGNGARPVEWMIMNDTCATHRSRVPRRSFGRNKRRSDDIGRRERTRPGFSLVFQCRHSSFYSFRSSSVGLETGEWRRCRSLSFTPPASLRSHGSRPRPTRHNLFAICSTLPVFLTMSINKSLYMDPYASRLVGPVTDANRKRGLWLWFKVGTNYWFVWPEGNWPPDWAWFLPRFFLTFDSNNC